MNWRAIKFRDVWVAPGSECYAALEAGDHAKADRIYEQCKLDADALANGMTVADWVVHKRIEQIMRETGMSYYEARRMI